MDLDYLKQTLKKISQLLRKRVRQLDVHRQRHAVDLVLVLRLVLPERAVPLQQLVEHAPKAEPVGAGVVRRALGQNLRGHVPVRSDAGVRFLLAEVASQAQVGDPDVAMLVQKYVGGFQVSVDDVPSVHVLEPENDLGRVELHLVLAEDAVLREVVVQVAAVHQVEDEAELVRRVEGVGHADDERTVLAGGDEAQHDSFVEGKRFALLHLDPLLVQTLHGVHLARVGFPASVDFSESSASDDPVNGEVVHAEGDVQFQIFPLAKTGKFVALDELLELDVIKRFFPSSLTRRQ